MVVSPVIDTGLILAALYLVLSVVVSSINEQIASLFHWRGNLLYSGVRSLLSGAEDLTKVLFSHPLIASSQYNKDGQIKAGESYRPSYIDARNFSLALWQSIGAAKTSQDATGKTVVAYDLGEASTAPEATIGTLPSQIALFASANLRTSLYALLSQAQGDYQNLLQSTDAWFNRQMDRVTGWYRRKTQYVVIAIAIVIVALLGVDTIKIVSRLYVNSDVAGALATSVATTVAQSSPGPAPAKTPPPALTYNEQLTLLSALDDPRFIGTFISGPIFFSSDDKSAEQRPMGESTHIAGVIVTIIVVSLGAPFWFDIFALFMNARMTGPRPPTSGSGNTQKATS